MRKWPARSGHGDRPPCGHEFSSTAYAMTPESESTQASGINHRAGCVAADAMGRLRMTRRQVTPRPTSEHQHFCECGLRILFGKTAFEHPGCDLRSRRHSKFRADVLDVFRRARQANDQHMRDLTIGAPTRGEASYFPFTRSQNLSRGDSVAVRVNPLCPARMTRSNVWSRVSSLPARHASSNTASPNCMRTISMRLAPVSRWDALHGESTAYSCTPGRSLRSLAGRSSS